MQLVVPSGGMQVVSRSNSQKSVGALLELPAVGIVVGVETVPVVGVDVTSSVGGEVVACDGLEVGDSGWRSDAAIDGAGVMGVAGACEGV